MVKIVNRVSVVGTVEEIDLFRRVSKASKRTFISGSLTLLVNEEHSVRVNLFQWADLTDKETGKSVPNPRYEFLNGFIEEDGETPRQEAYGTRTNIDGTISLNVFYNRDGEEIITAQNRGAFINQPRGVDKAEFSATAYLTGYIEELEDDRETGNIFLNGFVYDSYMKQEIPVRFLVPEGPGANYFKSSHYPLLTDVWGVLTSKKTTRVIESAFGEAQVIEGQGDRFYRVITGAAAVPHDINDEGFLNFKKEAEAGLQVVRSEQLDYHRSRQQQPATPTPAAAAPASSAAPKAGSFDF